MQGDYYRYKSEYAKGDALQSVTEDARAAYKKALEIAQELSTTDPVRLGLSLNYSVFLYEVDNNSSEAC